ncbi:MAG: hypothetical protein Q4D80_05370 [Pseudomonadota bacterium]|nr:hypothetical protein [Pseudomonadota bacterium]
MTTPTFANVIIHDLSSQNRLHENFDINRSIIDEVVENWDRKIYVIPHKALRFHHREIQTYLNM